MDKFGYYFAGGVKTYSKLEALQIGGASFHFNDEIYSSYDTTKEPRGTLTDVYHRRAQQIRQNYDYVVLMYSGGSDSHNVLASFLGADCKIDEICTFWDLPTTGLTNSFHNAEITKVVMPRMKELDHIKFRQIDLSNFIHLPFNILGNQFEYFINHHSSPNNITKHFLRDYIGDWKKMIDAGKRVVLVWGGEKPILITEGDRWYFTFCDRLDNMVGPYSNKPGWYDEMFYWTPDMPEIVVKQAHIIKYLCSQLNVNSWMWQQTPTECGYNKLINSYLTYDALKCIIYPSWNRNIYCNGKSWSMIYSARDTHFFKGNVNVDRYHQIIDSYFKQINDQTPRHKRFSLSPMFSKRYEI